MSKKIILALAFASVAAACAPKNDAVVVAPGGVSVEPVYQGKYGAN